MRTLRKEDIYDCLDDDDAFARLPGLVAEAIGARSAVFHWRSQDNGPLVLADSGYWSPERMGEYVDRYAEHDIWAQSTLTRQTRNRLWVIDELVPERVYGNSVFYNDWIRTMGDDTYHCAGMSMAGASGTGLIGLHRAKSSGAFESDNLARLSEHVGPVQRLMRVRGMLAEARGDKRLLSDTLDGLAIEVMVAGRDGRLLQANAQASQSLEAGGPLSVVAGKLTSRDAGNARTVQRAIDKATNTVSPESSFVRIATHGGLIAALTVAPIRHNGHRCAMLMLRMPVSAGLTAQLQLLFGLTASEAAIAIALSQGLSLPEIAATREVSVLTIRTQLKVAADKLGCRRQAEVVALIARLEPPRGL